MSISLLYVELLIIGVESSIGLTLLSLTFVTEWSGVEPLFSSAFGGIILLCVVYVIGLIFDRIADLFFQGKETSIADEIEKKHSDNYAQKIKESNITVTALLAPLKENQQRYIDYTRTRIRIMRGTSFNIIFVGMCLISYIILNSVSLDFICILIGALTLTATFLLCYSAYKNLVKDYNDKLYIFAIYAHNK